MKQFNNEIGAIPLLALVAIIGVFAFFAISYTLPFRNQILSTLFPKQNSRAATFSTAGFTETRWIQGLNSPTAMQFAPDGRLFVAQQGGQLRVIKNGQLLSTPFVSLSVDSFNERGLLGIAFDPNFSSNNYIYLFYTTTSNGINRISRFTANGDVAQSGSEVVIMDLDPHGAGNHNGGAMHFGADGKLYVATGDNANGSNSQIVTNRHGKLLRLNPVPDNTSTTTVDERIPTDNPASFDTSNGTLTPSGVNKSIWAMGFRNPFTFDIQSGTGKIYVNDVGDNGGIRWEEINDTQAGKNYGWPVQYGTQGDQNAKYTKPVHTYQSPGCAITGGAFYNPPSNAPNLFPSQYIGKYFFSDYCGGFIKIVDPANGAVSNFATAISSPVDIKDGPDGALYYLARGDGSVYRVVAGAVASPTPTPPGALFINFNDRTAGNLTGQYPTGAIDWGTGKWVISGPFEQLGDNNLGLPNQTATSGTFNILNGKKLQSIVAYNGHDSNASTVTIACSGNPTKSVSVPANTTMTISTDWTNSCTTVTITSSTGWDTNFDDMLLSDASTGGNQLPSATISTPASGTLYSSGQTVNFSGSATDPEDGNLGTTALSWLVEFHHNDPGSQSHVHPVLGGATPYTGASGSFVAATDHSTVNAFYRISLTATDSNGGKTTVSRDINPRSMNLTLATSPSGLQVTLNGVPRTAPYTELSVVGFNHEIGANTPQTLSGTSYNFSSWSDSGARIHNITAPTSNTTYTATFTPGATPTPTPTPTPSPTPTPPPNSQTLTFDDLGGAIHLNGSFYGIEWGNQVWHTYAPFGLFTTHSFTYNDGVLRSGNFTFTPSRILYSLDAYDENAANTITLSCAGNSTKTFNVPADSIVKLVTGWTQPCTTVTLASNLGWSTNFDNMVISTSSQPTPTPTATPTPTPTPPPTKLGDINGDNQVGMLDFAILLSKWNTNDTAADLNDDGTVGMLDFAILLSKWGT